MAPEGFFTRLRELHARGLTWPALLAAAVIAVLSHGALQRTGTPGATPSPAAPAASATPVSVLRPDLDAAPLSYVSDYWLQLGQRARSRIALVGLQRVPALVLQRGLALTSLTGGVEALGGDALVAAVDPDLELALVELPPETAPPPAVPADAADLRPGALMAAVTLHSDGRLRIAPGQLVSVPPLELLGPPVAGDLETTAALPRPTRAAALVDLEGRLLGGTFAASGGVRQLSAGALRAVLARLLAEPHCRALELGDLEGAARRLLGVDHGVLIERVRREAFAEEPALRAGDVLLTWRGERVSDVAGFRRLSAGDAPGTRVPHVVLRAGQRVRGTTVVPRADCRPVPAPARAYARLGLALAPAGTEPRVSDVPAAGAAARAGLLPGDRLLAVAGQPADSPGARAALAAFEKTPRPLLLTVRRDERVRLIAVVPQGE